MKPIAPATVKTRLENRRIGSTGSGARFSTGISSAVATTATTPRPMICHEPQPYVAPPRLVASTKQPAARLSRIVAAHVDARLAALLGHAQRDRDHRERDDPDRAC